MYPDKTESGRTGHLGLTGKTLKLIAVISMLIDHTGVVLIENNLLYPATLEELYELYETSFYTFWWNIDFLMRTCGRIAFPIFCFLLVEGFCYTRNIRKYAGMLLLFAFISEIPFNLAVSRQMFDIGYQNVFFTLFLGTAMMFCLKRWADTLVKQAGIVILFCGLAILIRCDYDYIGMLLIAAFYLFRERKRERTIITGVLAFLESWVCLGSAVLALIPIHFYNGERGKIRHKYWFYWFYPVHLLLLYLISIILL